MIGGAVKTLVVCYSNSGTTMIVAEYLAQALTADFDVIEEVKPRPPLLYKGERSKAGGGTFVKAVCAALFGRSSRIAATRKDPSQYDLVLVGTPIWAGSVTPAVRSYLRRHRKQLRRVAFFCTAGMPEKSRAFRQMKRLAGKQPMDTVGVKSDDVRTDACPLIIDGFVKNLKAAGQAEHLASVVAPVTRGETHSE